MRLTRPSRAGVSLHVPYICIQCFLRKKKPEPSNVSNSKAFTRFTYLTDVPSTNYISYYFRLDWLLPLSKQRAHRALAGVD
jgi:hypothetical protein